MLSVIKNHNLLKSNIPKLINLSGCTTDYLAGKLKLSQNRFIAKMTKNSFTHEEFEKLIAITWRDEFKDILDEEMFNQQMHQGKNLTATEFKQKMNWL